MMSATPIPSKPRSRKSAPAASRIFSRWAAACSRVTRMDAPFPIHLTLYMITVINTTYMRVIIKNDRSMQTAMTLTRQRTYSVVAGMLLVAFAIALFAAGHGKAATPPTPPPAPEVSVIYVQGEDVATYREYPARTHARHLLDVRGRVDWYIERRTSDIGSDVRAGQVLYVLDVRPYEAEVERARGALAQATADIAQAEAALLKARRDVERLEPLVEEEAAPRQDLDNARAARQAGQAPVAAP